MYIVYQYLKITYLQLVTAFRAELYRLNWRMLFVQKSTFGGGGGGGGGEEREEVVDERRKVV